MKSRVIKNEDQYEAALASEGAVVSERVPAQKWIA